MSKAARKARKQEQRETGQKYQHPSREGIPYGHSKQPYALPGTPTTAEMAATRAMLSYAKDAWPDHSRVRGHSDGGFR